MQVGRAVVGIAVCALAAGGYLHAAGLQTTVAAPVRPPGPSSTAATASSSNRALLDRYCVTCHSERLRTGNLILAKEAVDPDHVRTAVPVWEKVVQKLRSGAMPPAGRPRPDPSAVDALVSSLETSLDRTAAETPNPGRPTIHRLNRAEYANAIRDLLALDIGATTLLPPDDAAFGFDNNADVLTISPGLFERYMSTARRIARLAIGDPTLRPAVETYELSRYLLQDDRVSEDMPFGSRGGIAIQHYFPLDAEYAVKVQLQRRRPTDAQQLEIRVDGERVKLFQVGGSAAKSADDSENQSASGPFEVRLPVKAGPHLVAATFLQRTIVPDGLSPAYLPVGNISFRGKRGAEGTVERVEIAGPYNSQGPSDTPSRRRIFVCRPAARRSSPDTQASEDGCARRILGTLARRAYRRPIADQDLQKLLKFYRQGRAQDGFDAGIQSALERLLVDPQFLFRVEREPAVPPTGGVFRVSDAELASRLSFLLWSSIPDDELLDLATRGKLADGAVLEQQVRRMLGDPRASALVSNFAAQWLYLRNVRAVAPDVNAFPGFDGNLREALLEETELFVTSQLREDRSVVDLLTANYTFLNERLARHYGVPGIYGSHFRRVTITDPNRVGLLGQGSILMVTSYATRTSPVVRGKWLLENILGAPPPAPPANVPPLPDAGAEGRVMSVRERMEQHRKDPVCASCHAQMDPLGFALENYDAIGRWRSADETHAAIDSTAMLADGRIVHGPVELRELLVAKRENFVTTVTQKLLTYALGRGLEAYDMPAVRRIVRDAEQSDYRWSALILGIAKSVPFQMRRSES
jgi:cytochrome c5